MGDRVAHQHFKTARQLFDARTIKDVCIELERASPAFRQPQRNVEVRAGALDCKCMDGEPCEFGSSWLAKNDTGQLTERSKVGLFEREHALEQCGLAWVAASLRPFDR